MKPLAPEDWENITELFEKALALNEPDRISFLSALEISNPTWKNEIESLLVHHRKEGDFLERPIGPQDLETLLDHPHAHLRRGEAIGEFIVESVLGAGSFGTVYLARQKSLNRAVALKVSPNLGQEARTMATLEHDHIVKVYSETVDPHSNLRLICMQYHRVECNQP